MGPKIPYLIGFFVIALTTSVFHDALTKCACEDRVLPMTGVFCLILGFIVYQMIQAMTQKDTSTQEIATGN